MEFKIAWIQFGCVRSLVAVVLASNNPGTAQSLAMLHGVISLGIIKSRAWGSESHLGIPKGDTG